MKNHWLRKKQYNIKQTPVSFSDTDKWYCADNSMDEPNYLHKDNKWRKSTLNEKDEWTGYFDTREEIEKLLNS